MMRFSIFFFSIILTLSLFQSCYTKKGPYTYQICYQKKAKPSEYVFLYDTASNDTNLACIKGKVSEKENGQGIIYALVELVGTKSGTMTDTLGSFKHCIKPGIYDVKISYVGYISFLLKNLELKPGITKQIDFKLAEPGAFITTEFKSDKKLTRRQLQKKSEELSNK